jgi:type IV pilus assembly protein PilB
MSRQRKRLGEILVNLKLITPKQVEDAVAIQKESAEPLGTILISMGALSEGQLLSALAAQDGVSPWRLDLEPPTRTALAKVPIHVCRNHQVIPITIRGDLLILGMKNPHDLDAFDLVRNLTGLRVESVLVDERRLADLLDDPAKEDAQIPQVDGLVMEALDEFQGGARTVERAMLSEVDTRPVVGLVNQILSDAIRAGASDVHIEPRFDRVDIRYRVDGHLRKVRDIPIRLHPMFVTRLKIMAEMDIVEFRVPQDGRVSATIDGRDIDLRVSTVPNQHGQRVVLRILDKTRALKRLDDIGFTKENLELFRSIVRRPYGIFLVTGPTGSGKTTTLYAALQELANSKTNIMTCEDPIEYEIDGINQGMVNEKVGLTFAAQLRAILRQDPDIILVGEIRDQETAETAIRAALTGHLVLSTLHCNDAPSAIPRLIDMGVDPFLLSTSLVGIMSQRLLRKVCPLCAGRQTFGEARCSSCRGIGFKGRTSVQEIMPITWPVAAAIGRQAPMDELAQLAYQAGYRPMSEGARELIDKGVTTEEEARTHVFFNDDGQNVPFGRGGMARSEVRGGRRVYDPELPVQPATPSLDVTERLKATGLLGGRRPAPEGLPAATLGQPSPTAAPARTVPTPTPGGAPGAASPVAPAAASSTPPVSPLAAPVTVTRPAYEITQPLSSTEPKPKVA